MPQQFQQVVDQVNLKKPLTEEDVLKAGKKPTGLPASNLPDTDPLITRLAEQLTPDYAKIARLRAQGLSLDEAAKAKSVTQARIKIPNTIEQAMNEVYKDLRGPLRDIVKSYLIAEGEIDGRKVSPIEPETNLDKLRVTKGALAAVDEMLRTQKLDKAFERLGEFRYDRMVASANANDPDVQKRYKDETYKGAMIRYDQVRGRDPSEELSPFERSARARYKVALDSYLDNARSEAASGLDVVYDKETFLPDKQWTRRRIAATMMGPQTGSALAKGSYTVDRMQDLGKDVRWDKVDQALRSDAALRTKVDKEYARVIAAFNKEMRKAGVEKSDLARGMIDPYAIVAGASGIDMTQYAEAKRISQQMEGPEPADQKERQRFLTMKSNPRSGKVVMRGTGGVTYATPDQVDSLFRMHGLEPPTVESISRTEAIKQGLAGYTSKEVFSGRVAGITEPVKIYERTRGSQIDLPRPLTGADLQEAGVKPGTAVYAIVKDNPMIAGDHLGSLGTYLQGVSGVLNPFSTVARLSGKPVSEMSEGAQAFLAAADSVFQIALGMGATGATAGVGWRGLTNLTQKILISDTMIDVVDGFSAVDQLGGEKGAQAVADSLISQFSPGTFVDPNATLEEKAVAGVSQAFLLLGGGLQLTAHIKNARLKGYTSPFLEGSQAEVRTKASEMPEGYRREAMRIYREILAGTSKGVTDPADLAALQDFAFRLAHATADSAGVVNEWKDKGVGDLGASHFDAEAYAGESGPFKHLIDAFNKARRDAGIEPSDSDPLTDRLNAVAPLIPPRPTEPFVRPVPPETTVEGAEAAETGTEAQETTDQESPVTSVEDAAKRIAAGEEILVDPDQISDDLFKQLEGLADDPDIEAEMLEDGRIRLTKAERGELTLEDVTGKRTEPEIPEEIQAVAKDDVKTSPLQIGTEYNTSLDPRDIQVEKGVQFKEVTDTQSMTGESLKDVDVYDVDAAGELLVWEKNDGSFVVIHGHHRLDLAKRARKFVRKGPDGPVEVDPMVRVSIRREADGWTLQKVRQLGAIENLQAGTAKPLETVKALRELGVSPEGLREQGISLKGSLARNVAGLLRLPEEALNHVGPGKLSEEAAAGIGSVEALNTPEALMGAVTEALENNIGRSFGDGNQFGRIFAFNMEGEFGVGDQEVLINVPKARKSTLKGQAAIWTAVENQIVKEARDYKSGTGLKELEGERIDVDKRKELLDAMGGSPKAAQEKLDFLFDRDGEIQDKLKSLGGQVASGDLTVQDAAKQLYSDVLEGIARPVKDLVAGRPSRGDGEAKADTKPVGRDEADQGVPPQEGGAGTDALFGDEEVTVDRTFGRQRFVDSLFKGIPDEALDSHGIPVSLPGAAIFEGTLGGFEMTPDALAEVKDVLAGWRKSLKGDPARLARVNDYQRALEKAKSQVTTTPIARSAIKDANERGAKATYAHSAADLGVKTVYRDMSVDAFLHGSPGPAGSFWSNTSDLALGQGENKGLLLEFEPKPDTPFQINLGKPGLPLLAEQGQYELIVGAGAPGGIMLGEPVSVTISPSAKASKSDLAILTGRMRGWSKTTLADGSVRYERPPDSGGTNAVQEEPDQSVLRPGEEGPGETVGVQEDGQATEGAQAAEEVEITVLYGEEYKTGTLAEHEVWEAEFKRKQLGGTFKESWEMTMKEVADQTRAKPGETPLEAVQQAIADHREAVEQALMNGRPVPPDVLAEYPSLQQEFTDTPQSVKDLLDQKIDDIDAAIEAKKKAMEKRGLHGGMGMGLGGADPVAFRDWVELGALYSKKYALKTEKWAILMVRAVGDQIKPYLDEIKRILSSADPDAELDKLFSEADDGGAGDVPGGSDPLADPLAPVIADEAGPGLPDESGEATITVEGRNRQKGGPGWYERLFSTPLSIRVGDRILVRGTIARIGGELGRKIEDAFWRARVDSFNLERDWKNSLRHIKAEIETTAKERGVDVEEYMGHFVDLVEMDFDDPARQRVKASDTPEGRALKLHDELSEQMRQYIIETRRGLGIEMPDDWGITEKGYFRHLFLGDIRIIVNGNLHGTAHTYFEAQKIAVDLTKENPGKKMDIRIKARNIVWGDPTLRVSNGQFFKVMNQIAEDVDLTMEDIMEDVRGTIGRKQNRMKFLGALMKRKGFGGYSRSYYDTMLVHMFQVVRSQELSKLNRAVQPKMEQMRKDGQIGLSDFIQDHLDDLWGIPKDYERAFGESVSRGVVAMEEGKLKVVTRPVLGLAVRIPVLRRAVQNPTMALRSLARGITRFNNGFRLNWNIKSSVVNRMQPTTTLAPIIGWAKYAQVEAQTLKGSNLKLLLENGVLQGATKIEEGRTYHFHDIPSTFFSAASAWNRAIGYTYGYHEAIKNGLSPDVAHEQGLSWAERVEFDSQWNAAPVARHPIGKVLFQYKGFTAKNFESIYSILGKMEGDRAFDRFNRWWRLGAAYALQGGAKTVLSPTAWMIGYITLTLSRKLQDLGMEEEDADKWADAMVAGAPTWLGIDMSQSVTIVDTFGDNPTEKTVNFLLGPTVSSAVNLVTEASNAFNARSQETRERSINRMLRSVSPYVRQLDAAQQLYETGTVGLRGPGGQEIELSTSDMVMYALGFSPRAQSYAYEHPLGSKFGLGSAASVDVLWVERQKTWWGLAKSPLAELEERIIEGTDPLDVANAKAELPIEASRLRNQAETIVTELKGNSLEIKIALRIAWSPEVGRLNKSAWTTINKWLDAEVPKDQQEAVIQRVIKAVEKAKGVTSGS